jgi:mono/diheme cytochrome c family protein
MGLVKAIAAVGLVVILSACGGRGGEPPAAASSDRPDGDPARGEQLFQQTVVGDRAAPGCITCHSLQAGVTLVGPPVAGMAGRAGLQVSGQAAEEYLYEAIVRPDAHVVEGFAGGIMYREYGDRLTDEQIADLVAYMMTLK